MSTLDYLIEHLIKERPELGDIEMPMDDRDRFRLYRSLVNIRPAMPADDEYLSAEEEYLKGLTREKGITELSDLTPNKEGLYLWQGDITTLRCEAIVNAANSGMTGCWQPCHSCIDNCIHTFAGVGLRLECDSLMRAQGHEEPTGRAKLTRAYALPCRYVIHTVGPIVRGPLNDEHRRLLSSSYQSCLELAVQENVQSIAFCCISTGVFGFPQEAAAEIAVSTVHRFRETSDITVIFNVFTDRDRDIYERLLFPMHNA